MWAALTAVHRHNPLARPLPSRTTLRMDHGCDFAELHHWSMDFIRRSFLGNPGHEGSSAFLRYQAVD